MPCPGHSAHYVAVALSRLALLCLCVVVHCNTFAPQYFVLHCPCIALPCAALALPYTALPLPCPAPHCCTFSLLLNICSARHCYTIATRLETPPYLCNQYSASPCLLPCHSILRNALALDCFTMLCLCFILLIYALPSPCRSASRDAFAILFRVLPRRCAPRTSPLHLCLAPLRVSVPLRNLAIQFLGCSILCITVASPCGTRLCLCFSQLRLAKPLRCTSLHCLSR